LDGKYIALCHPVILVYPTHVRVRNPSSWLMTQIPHCCFLLSSHFTKLLWLPLWAPCTWISFEQITCQEVHQWAAQVPRLCEPGRVCSGSQSLTCLEIRKISPTTAHECTFLTCMTVYSVHQFRYLSRCEKKMKPLLPLPIPIRPISPVLACLEFPRVGFDRRTTWNKAATETGHTRQEPIVLLSVRPSVPYPTY